MIKKTIRKQVIIRIPEIEYIYAIISLLCIVALLCNQINTFLLHDKIDHQSQYYQSKSVLENNSAWRPETIYKRGVIRKAKRVGTKTKY